MNYIFSPEHEMIRTVVREFAKNEVEPLAAEIDKSHRFPIETFKKMAECGITGLSVPREFGGAAVGSDRLGFIIAIEELAKVCLSTAAILAINTGLPAMIGIYGTKEQRKKYLPRIVEEGWVTAFALTEPGAGSDAAGVRTTATLDGDEYILNGTKCFTSGGGIADLYVIVAITDKSKGYAGFTSFIVEPGTPGFTIGKIEEKMGIHASQTAELIFEDCRIPKENVLGKLGSAFKVAMTGLDSGRIGTAAQAVGLAQGAYDLALKYSCERKQFGMPINKFQGIQWYLAEMATKIEAARSLTYYAAHIDSQGKACTKEAAMAKLFASQVAREVVNTAVQIHGGYGYMSDYAVERMYRDAKILEIYEGTSEIMKTVIASSIIPKSKKKKK
ncbi:acyl-CoA dehydrogenase family protein [Romboutsia sp.]|uniref:acyl-CoA dehydrogenase family protein n=1 Tax=Romboutsia sp. TaxID=1965302 RepID=UPI003F34B89A